MYKFLLITFLSFILVLPNYAQNEADTVETEEWDDWDDWDDYDWGEKFHRGMFNVSGSPTIALSYGLAKMDHKNLAGSFSDPRSVELKLGYTDFDKVWRSSYITQTSFKYVSVANITTDLAGTDVDPYTSNNWKIGIGNNSGYGYKMGASALYFTSGGSIDWTRIRLYSTPEDPDIEITDLYHDSFRFGTSFEAGVRFQVIRQISLEADYQRAVVFPRHLFWKWLGSAAIEGAAQFMIDRFVDEIIDSSPYFAPVMSFLLKNGLNYGIYELRKEKMNWPFNSEPPLTIDQFKFGITFTL
jgi:hypothetical protein